MPSTNDEPFDPDHDIVVDLRGEQYADYLKSRRRTRQATPRELRERIQALRVRQ